MTGICICILSICRSWCKVQTRTSSVTVAELLNCWCIVGLSIYHLSLSSPLTFPSVQLHPWDWETLIPLKSSYIGAWGSAVSCNWLA